MSTPSRRRRGLRLVLPPEGLSVQLLGIARVTGARGLPVVLSARAFADLVAELGGGRAVWAFVQRLAAASGRPVFVNGPRSDGLEGSCTVAIPPPGWTQERLNGYAAGFKDELEAMFGGIDGRPHWPGRAA